MAMCANCNAVLAPAWKYCIYCGVATTAAAAAALRPSPAHHAEPGRRLPTVPLVIAGGALVFMIGIGLIVMAAVMFYGS